MPTIGQYNNDYASFLKAQLQESGTLVVPLRRDPRTGGSSSALYRRFGEEKLKMAV